MLALEKQGISAKKGNAIKVFVATTGAADERRGGFLLLNKLRKANISAEMDYQNKSLRAQLKIANRLGASYTAIVGEQEFQENQVSLRDMNTGEQSKVLLSDFIGHISELTM